MKKMLMLTIVLGLASLANAGLLISVNGQIDPPDSVIALMPSQSVTLDVHSQEAGFEGYWFMVCQTSQGTISGGYIDIADPDISGMCFIMDGAVSVGGVPLDPSYEGVLGGAFGSISPAKPVPSGRIFDGIEFHCEGPGDTIITLQELTPEWGLGVIYDQVVIHQIPEPATVLILSIGGLLLKRRK